MNKANISYMRNHLSRMLSRVKEGESILVLDRQEPVARMEPVTGRSAPGLPWREDLVRRGLIRPARRGRTATALSNLRMPTCRKGGDVLKALLADREEGR